ncbi:MAG: hypothetical protein IK115_12640, partial [Lachnospiraceae bacterium]|nr:hypothetical protein [Lachnospiraceae bacterium]
MTKKKLARILKTIGSILWLGVLWLVCSLTLITLPVASMAAYHAASRVIRRHESGLTSVFFLHMGKQLKRWLPVAVLEGLVLAWLLFDIYYFYAYGTEFSRILSALSYGILFLFLEANVVIFPCASRFAGSRSHIIRTAIFICFRHVWASLLLTVLFLAAVFCVLALPPSLLILPGFYWYVSSLLLEPLLKKYSVPRPGDEDEEEE